MIAYISSDVRPYDDLNRPCRRARGNAARWRARGHVLTGLVDSRYARCLIWLAHEGFDVSARPAAFIGRDRVPFLQYRRA